MTVLFISISFLIASYFIYGRYVERIFQVRDEQMTPAYLQRDEVDFVPLSKAKNGLIQLLNIAGMGPIYGPILGAIWGPVSLLWILLGAVFAGAVHDYFIGMISVRHRGAHLPEITREFFGHKGKAVMALFILSLLLLVGTMFVRSPVTLIDGITPSWLTSTHILCAIFAYYFLSTILPIHQIIGKLYPLLGFFFFSCTLWIAFCLFRQPEKLSQISWFSLPSPSLPLFPSLFLTISCGALSGFHATQSPLLSRTLRRESDGKCVFYGMMIAEACIAFIWGVATLALIDHEHLVQILTGGSGGPEAVVTQIANQLIGPWGRSMAIGAIAILPLTSGDTAFRCARIILGDSLNISQKPVLSRLLLALPLFGGAIFLLHSHSFFHLWSYFSLSNQLVASFSLWISTLYLRRERRSYWITTIPAFFITTVCLTHILRDPAFALSLSQFLSLLFSLLLTSLLSLLLLRNPTSQLPSQRGLRASTQFK